MDKYKTVDEFLGGLDEERRALALKLREYITETDSSLTEHIKWNAPSYIKDGEDRITFNTTNKESKVKLVFHMGATRKEDKNARPLLANAPMIEWVSDIRGYATFDRIGDVTRNEAVIKQVVQDWLALR